MRSKRELAVLAFALFLAGCSNNLNYILYSPQKQVLAGMSYDQSFNNHAAKLPKGPVVEGSDCGFIFSASGMEQVRRNAYQDAIKKAGPPYDSLINAKETYSAYPPLINCFSIKGTSAKYEEYYGAEASRTSKQ